MSITLSGLTEQLRDLFFASQTEIAARLQFLPDKPEESAITTVAALWHTAAGCPVSAQKAGRSPLPFLDDIQIARFRDLMARRLQGVPLAYLTQRQHFMGLEFLASPDALIPRQETELLAAIAIDLLSGLTADDSEALAVDACTGSGNLALAMAAHTSCRRILGADLSAEAVALAQSNAAHLDLDQRVSFYIGDLLQPFLDAEEYRGKVDLLVCNPPYISSPKVDTMQIEIAEHEPRLAFDGGPLGIRIVQRLIGEAPALLKSGGWLAFEVGLGQGRGIVQRMERGNNYQTLELHADRDGNARVIVARAR